MRSNSYQGPHTLEEVVHDEAPETPCTACHGRGEDRHGDDCMVCAGYGTVLLEQYSGPPL